MYINKRKNLVHVKRVITAAEQEQKFTLKKKCLIIISYVLKIF